MTRRMTLALRVFGRSRDELDRLRLERLAERVDDAAPRSRCASAVAGVVPGAQHAEADERLALQRVGHADGRGLEHGRVLDEHRLHFGRAEPLAGDLDRVVGAAEDVPEAVVVDRRPVAVHPHAGEARPVGLARSARGSRQKPRVMPIHGARTTSSPTWLRTGLPCVVHHVGGDAGRRTGEGRRLERRQHVAGDTMPPEISVPPE